MMESNIAVKTKIYKMVPPDGGWGYMICISYIINMIPITIYIATFGILYNDLMIQLHLNTTNVNLLSGISLMTHCLAGFFTSSFLKLMNMRKLALFSSCLLNIGIIGTLFVNTTAVFIVTQVLQSFGMGILYNLSFTAINDYFIKRRLFIVSAGAFISAFAGIIAPLLVEWGLESLGFKGTIIMIAGIVMHTFIASVVLQPVSWHMVKVEEEATINGNDEIKSLLDKNNTSEEEVTTPTITNTNTDEPFEAKIDIVKIDTLLHKGNDPSKSIFDEFLDAPMLKKFFTSNASMGPAFCMFSDVIFLIMLPQALYASNWSKDLVAKAVFLTTLGDLIMRIVFTCVSKWLTKFGNQEVYLVSVVLGFVSRLCMHSTDNVILVLISITLIGVARCSTMVLPSLIIADVFGPEKFTKALGVFMVVTGSMNLVLGPCIGAIRDMTHSYTTAFFVVTSCYAAIIILWSIELWHKNNKHKKIQQQLASENLKSLNVKNKEK